jgi:hypothetical protein
MGWIEPAEDRDRSLVNSVMNLWVPQNAGNFLTSWETVSFLRKTLLKGVGYAVNMILGGTYTYFGSLEKMNTVLILQNIEIWFFGRLARCIIIVATDVWHTTLLQVPAKVPSERGGAIHTAHARHSRHGDTSGAGHVVSAQPANLSQRPGHTQLRVSFDASHNASVISPNKAGSCLAWRCLRNTFRG